MNSHKISAKSDYWNPFKSHFWFKTCTLGGGCFGLKISHSKLFSMDSENFYTNLFADHWKSCIFARGLGFFKPGLESDSNFELL